MIARPRIVEALRIRFVAGGKRARVLEDSEVPEDDRQLSSPHDQLSLTPPLHAASTLPQSKVQASIINIKTRPKSSSAYEHKHFILHFDNQNIPYSSKYLMEAVRL